MLLSFVCYFVKVNFFADAILHDVETYFAFFGIPDTREVLGNLRFTVLGVFCHDTIFPDTCSTGPEQFMTAARLAPYN